MVAPERRSSLCPHQLAHMRVFPIMRAAFSLERPDATSSLNARRSLLVVPCMASPQQQHEDDDEHYETKSAAPVHLSYSYQ